MRALKTFVVPYMYDITTNERLEAWSLFKFWDSGLKKYVYVFNEKDRREVEMLTGKPIVYDDDTLNVIPTYLDQWKGKSGFDVKKAKNIYQVTSYQKPKKSDKPTKQVHLVTENMVTRLYNVIRALDKDKGKKIEFKVIAKAMCMSLGITRFNRKSGTFDHQKFQGTRCPAEYGKYYYYPLKVLQFYGVVEHSGRYTLLKNKKWRNKNATIRNDTGKDIERTRRTKKNVRHHQNKHSKKKRSK